MEWTLTFWINSILLGIGLAMDAFSVSLTNGLNEPKMNGLRMSLIAGVYAVFQFAMPMIGWVCVHTIVHIFEKFTIVIPWIALLLLVYIGGKMLIEGIQAGKDADTNNQRVLTVGLLLVQGIATSIDALSVGFAIAEYGLLQAFVASAVIAVETFGICMVGLVLGRQLGMRLSGKAEILGGVILIGIGIEIFIKGVFFG